MWCPSRQEDDSTKFAPSHTIANDTATEPEQLTIFRQSRDGYEAAQS